MRQVVRGRGVGRHEHLDVPRARLGRRPRSPRRRTREPLPRAGPRGCSRGAASSRAAWPRRTGTRREDRRPRPVLHTRAMSEGPHGLAAHDRPLEGPTHQGGVLIDAQHGDPVRGVQQDPGDHVGGPAEHLVEVRDDPQVRKEAETLISGPVQRPNVRDPTGHGHRPRAASRERSTTAPGSEHLGPERGVAQRTGQVRRVPAGHVHQARPTHLLGDRRVIGLGAVVDDERDRLDAQPLGLLGTQTGPLGQDGRPLGRRRGGDLHVLRRATRRSGAARSRA